MDYQSLLKYMISDWCGQSRTLIIQKPLIEFLDGDLYAALFLSQIFYWAGRTKDSEGWFYKSYEQWNEEIPLSEYQIRRITNLLKDKGILETKVKKLKTSTGEFLQEVAVHYRIDWIIFAGLFERHMKKVGNLKNLSSQKPTPSNNPEPEELKIPHYNGIDDVHRDSIGAASTFGNGDNPHTKVNKPKESSPKRKSTFSGFSEKKVIESTEEKCTKLMSYAVKSKRGVVTEKDLVRWKKEFEDFLNTYDVDEDAFLSLMKWFSKNAADKYTPRINSAKKFCERYNDVLEAKDRKETDIEQTPKQVELTKEECERHIQELMNHNKKSGLIIK